MTRPPLRADLEKAVGIGVSRCAEGCVAVNLIDGDGEVSAQAHVSLDVARSLLDDIARCCAGSAGRLH